MKTKYIIDALETAAKALVNDKGYTTTNKAQIALEKVNACLTELKKEVSK